MSDQFDLSGDFRGAIINIKSTLTNVQQAVSEIPSNDTTSKEELKKLIEQLSQTLEKAPEDKKEQAEAVAELAKVLVETAKTEKPNKTMLKITGEGLKQAAQNLAEAMPSVIAIAAQIASVVFRMTGVAG